MKKIIEQIKKESLTIQKHALLVREDHIFKCDVVMGNDINIIQDSAKLIQKLIEKIEKG